MSSHSLRSAAASVVFSIMAVAATNASAATTGSLILRGAIAANCSLSVTADAASTALDLSSASAVKVGTLNVACNNARGYTVSASSPQSGSLVETTNTTSSVPYELTIVGTSGVGAVQPSNGGANIATSGTANAPVNRTNDINFAVKTNTNAMAGTFQDTVTFTLATP